MGISLLIFTSWSLFLGLWNRTRKCSFFFFFLATACNLWDPSSPTGIKPASSAVKVWNLNYLTAPELPRTFFFSKINSLWMFSDISNSNSGFILNFDLNLYFLFPMLKIPVLSNTGNDTRISHNYSFSSPHNRHPRVSEW